MNDHHEMETTLTKLLQQSKAYASCHSLFNNERNENSSAPINPFHKRVFQRKSRKSQFASKSSCVYSVPKYSSVREDELQKSTEIINQPFYRYYQQVDELIETFQLDLEDFKACTKSQIKSIYEQHQSSYIGYIETFLMQVKSLILSARRACMNQSPVKSEEKGITLNVSCNQNNQNIEAQNSKNFNVKRDYRFHMNESAQKKRIKAKRRIQNKPKSIYESILEEREGKRKRKKVL